ncbi:FAD-binding oxidoreductase [Pseudofrankia inefficax]|uniref:FAD linked oxidase domain protein n=1 Tax=Pseudofrankia inefficax (strain DSM 45817 / CECT 9037 / DDB 130130 / EuI1c) TaxID=298654 RepID=E3J6E6_PSEI1|nr:FAD-binding oxidoreductase [Pseudofrankia inefficax]ADP79573.1 FAD linked oxidase domain protein [Pseudofrankia inefficax]
MSAAATTTTDARVADLRRAVGCDVIAEGDAGYDVLRRVWNADIDRHPLAIVRATSATDVVAALQHCVAAGLPITVRGGGHNLAGTAVLDGAVMIDTGLLRSVELDERTGRVAVGAGCRWGDVDQALAGHGLAVPAGVVSHTGVAGLTLGGGLGYLSRMFGATVDHVEQIEVVVADGRILTVTEQDHPELFWALRGAGHNFGIVTRFVFRTIALPGLVTIRQQLFGASDRRAILRFFHEWGPAAPGNMGTYIRLLRAPEYWSQIPAEHRGEQIISVATIFYGDPAGEAEATAPMFALADPIYSSLRTIPHVTLQHSTDDEFRYGLGHYWKHTSLDNFDDEGIDVVLRFVDEYPGRSLNSSAHIAHQLLCPFELIAGTHQPRPRPNDSTAGIESVLSVNIGADWRYPSEKAPLVDWARRFDNELEPYRNGTYINFTSVAGDEEMARSVYGDKYERLARAKRLYDPNNVFSRGLVNLAENEDSVWAK